MSGKVNVTRCACYDYKCDGYTERQHTRTELMTMMNWVRWQIATATTRINDDAEDDGKGDEMEMIVASSAKKMIPR